MMLIVTIRELDSSGAIFKAAVEVSTGAKYTIAISAPITAEEQSHVSWYFGEWLASPFADSGRASLAEEVLKRSGEGLFESVFGSENGRQAWASLLEREGTKPEIRVEIIGSSAFQRFPWEWMRKPGLEDPIALIADIVRTGGERGILRRDLKANTLNILVVRSHPRRVDVNQTVVARPLLRIARSVKVPIRVHVLRPSTITALEDHLRQTERRHGLGYYHIIHFDVHGSLQRLQRESAIEATLYACLHLEPTEAGGSADIDAHKLAGIIEPHGAGMVVMTACESAKHDTDFSMAAFSEELVNSGLPCVLGMAEAISTTAVEYFVGFFYLALTFGGNPLHALRLARHALRESNVRGTAFDTGRALQDWMLPIMYLRTEPRFVFSQMGDGPHDATRSLIERYAKNDPIGRDLDTMNLEHLLLAGRKVILVVAGPGVGKTTFLSHLGSFWSMTGFVDPDHVERFGLLNEKYSVDEITKAIARHGKSGQRLILIDDLDRLGIENPADLLHVASETEAWVIATTRQLTPDLVHWREDVYMLPPIDLIKATELTHVLLFGNDVQTNSTTFDSLADWIGGVPLAIKGIIPELLTRSSAQLLDDIETGDLDIDRPEPKVGTHTLRGSIEHAMAALSPMARSSILYLAPFGPEVSYTLLADYAESLRDQAPDFVEAFEGLFTELVTTSLVLIRSDASYEKVWINPLLTIYLRHVLRQPVLKTLRETINSGFLRVVQRHARTLVNQEIAGSQEVQSFARQGYVHDRYTYQHALRLGIEHRDVSGDVYFAAAQGFSAVGRSAEAVRIGELVAEAIATSSLTMSADVAHVLQKLAELHLAQGNSTRTRDLIALMRNHWSLVDDPDRWLLGGLLHLEAELALRGDDSTEAEVLLRQVLDISNGNITPSDLLPTKMHLANALVKQKRFAEAERYANEVFDSGSSDHRLQGDALHLLGLCSFWTGRMRESIQAFGKAIRAYRLVGANDRAAISHGGLARAYRASGLKRDAYDNFMIALRLGESIIGGGAIAQLHEEFGRLLLEMDRPRDAQQQFQNAARAWSTEGLSERAGIALNRALAAETAVN